MSENTEFSPPLQATVAGRHTIIRQPNSLRPGSWPRYAALFLLLGSTQEAIPADGGVASWQEALSPTSRSRNSGGPSLPAVFPANKLEMRETPATLDAVGGLQATGIDTNLPPRCQGYGSVQSISLTTWESGLAPWTAGTYAVQSPSTFDTPDWAAVGSLPAGRIGNAAFVANLPADCNFDNETGVLTLLGPAIIIPNDVSVPRISIDHWFGTEQYWDGGNIKYKLNGSPDFELLPAEAIEHNPYNETLLSSTSEALLRNPLTGQPAYSGPDFGGNGVWSQIRVNLLGIAAPGDSIQLRFDFGVDWCDGKTGWYVDDVEFYSCSDELLPSNCGNLALDPGEQCDDGNNFIGDGCSNTCQVEPGWQCTAPKPPGTIGDPGFEAGTPNPSWSESSTNFDYVICNVDDCTPPPDIGAASGMFWAWFGGWEDEVEPYEPTHEEAYLSQTIIVPATATDLTFQLRVADCDSAADYLEITIDDTSVFRVEGDSLLCEQADYQTHSVDITPFADGNSHELVFHAETFSNNLDVTNILLDDLAIPGVPSECTADATAQLILDKVVVNDNGGTAVESNWTLSASGPTPISGPGAAGSNDVQSGPGFAPGTYTLSESAGPVGYTAGAWVCTGTGSQIGDEITLMDGQSATCTITNNDNAPSLTLNKVLIKDNGGSAVESNWTLSAAGPTPLSGPGAAGGADVVSGPSFDIGTYTLSETGGPAGYTASAWSCTGTGNQSGSQITLGLGQSAVCTITNNDNAPSLTLDKIVVNDNGGTAAESSWTLSAAGPTPISGPGAAGSTDVVSGPSFDMGTYTLSESAGPGGYQASAWSCTGSGSQNGSQITLTLGQSAICTITNNDVDVSELIFSNGFESD